MNDPRSVLVRGSDDAFTHGLVEGLERAGWNVGAGDIPDQLDLSVLVPDFGPPAPLLDDDEARWFDIIDSSLTRAFLFAKQCLPPMKRSRGALVFVSSIFAEIGAPNRTAACAAAAGIVGLAKALTFEVPSVRFGVVASAIPRPAEPWRAPDVRWEGAEQMLDERSIEAATVEAVLLLANDVDGHHKGSVIRLPSGITT